MSGRPLTFCKWGKWKPSGEHDAAIMCKRSISGEQGVFGSVNRTGRRNAYICEITNGKLFVLFYQRKKEASPKRSLLTQIPVDIFRTLCPPNEKA